MSTILSTTVMPCLNETNYLTWHIRMHALLIRSDLWGVISGTEPTPDPTATEIALYVDDSQIIHVQGDDPKVIWDTLASIYRAHDLSTQLAAMRKFSCMEKRPKQSIMSWVSDVKAQAHLMKDIRIKLPDLLTIVILTSGLSFEYDSVVVAFNAVKSNELTLNLTISHLLNKEERHLSHKQLDN
ncbi:hypothetical protein HD554DRAFT_2175109 [Boletus coccyginus]|nr:hypothetical protein HD554DRAFT_2175109 [Boletus coccyginus]